MGSTRPSPLQFVALAALAVGCAEDPSGSSDDDDSASVEPGCEAGYLLDGDTCVPEACGIGTWGNLEVGPGTVYVDIQAGSGGDGSAEAPYRAIWQGLNAVTEAGGGMVALAAGTYVEGV